MQIFKRVSSKLLQRTQHLQFVTKKYTFLLTLSCFVSTTLLLSACQKTNSENTSFAKNASQNQPTIEETTQTEQKTALDTLNKALEKINLNATNLQNSAIANLKEVHIDNKIAYTDGKRYLIMGELIDLETGENLTQQAQEKLNIIDWKSLPLQQALVWEKGKSTEQRTFAVFADPNCGYCKKLEKELQTLDNVKIYTFLLPVLGEKSLYTALKIQCDAMPMQAWQAWMLNGIEPSLQLNETFKKELETTQKPCLQTLQKNMQFAQKYGIQGTPALIFKDGTRIPGFIDAATIEKYLNK